MPANELPAVGRPTSGGDASSERAFFESLRARRRWVPATLILVAINLALFGWRLLRGVPAAAQPDWQELVRLGASYGPLSTGGERWRLFASTFVHRDYVHLGYNVAFLAVLGRYLERIYGSVAFAVIYLTSAVVASVAISLWAPLHVVYGASGGVAGVAGALMGFTLRRRLDVDEAVRKRLRNAGFFIIGFGALAGLLNRHVSDVGHMTGLVVGFSLGLALAAPELTRSRRPLLLVAASLLAAGSIWIQPRVWDVAGERQRADGLYAALTVRYGERLAKHEAGALAQPDFLAFVDGDIVPSLARLETQLARVPPRGDDGEPLTMLLRLIRARHHQLLAMVQASRSHDPADLSRAAALESEAEKLADAYRARR